MSILSDFEDRVASAVEGVFAGVFRAPVQPAELARACGKEMDRRKKLGVGKIYAPTLYSVLLSEADGEALGGFSDTLAGELETYLIGRARERGYELTIRPRVRFLVADDLKLGRFEVIGELLSEAELVAELGPTAGHDYHDPESEKPEPPVRARASAGADAGVAAGAVGAVGTTGVAAGVSGLAGLASSNREPVVAAAMPTSVFGADAPEHDPDLATITVTGIDHDVALAGERMRIGRLQDCDICLTDVNASREHALLEREGNGWCIVDLGSTNGTQLNGAPVDRDRLRDGDSITIGVTELIYHEPRG